MAPRRIEIKRIESNEARQVCFSKRRIGLFNMANELSIICGAEIGIIVFSPAGKPFSFGHPSVDSVIDRFLSGSPSPTTLPSAGLCTSAAHEMTVVHDLNQHYTMLAALLQTERRKKTALEMAVRVKREAEAALCGAANIEELGLGELERLHDSLERLRDMAMRVDQLVINPASARSSRIAAASSSAPPPPSSSGVNLGFGSGLEESMALPPPIAFLYNSGLF